MFAGSRPGWVFGEDCHSALHRMCSSRGVLQFWRDLHRTALGRAPPDGSGPGRREMVPGMQEMLERPARPARRGGRRA